MQNGTIVPSGPPSVPLSAVWLEYNKVASFRSAVDTISRNSSENTDTILSDIALVRAATAAGEDPQAVRTLRDRGGKYLILLFGTCKEYPT